MKKLGVVLLVISMLLVMVPGVALAGVKTLTLQEDWRLTSDLDLSVGSGDTLIIDGGGTYYIYEMGGILKNTATGAVYLKDTGIYAQGDSPAAATLAALSKAARNLTSVAAPAKDATALTLPAVSGYTVTVKTSDKPEIISTGSVIVPPSAAATVTLVLTLTDAKGNKADTAAIPVAVPAKSTVTTPSDNPSTGTGYVPPQQSVPAGDSGVQVDYSRSGNVATLSLPAYKVTEIIEKAKDSAVFDLSGVTDVSAAALPKEALSGIAKAGLGTEIRLPAGKLVLNPAAAQSVVSQLSGADLSVGFKKVDESSLTPAQKQAVQAKETVLDISISSGTETIHRFDGTITATVSYEGPLPVGVWHLTETGERDEQIPGSYDAAARQISFDAPHFSLYVLGQDKTALSAWTNPFADVKSSDWFYKDVEFAVTNGLFEGISSASFSPAGPMTRGMLVTVLGRFHKVEIGGYRTSVFADVKAGQYYAPYVEWARSSGIVEGVGDELFAPDTAVSRQDLAAILTRYAAFAGKPLAVSASSEVIFADQTSVSDYALSAIAALHGAGILEGHDQNRIDPQGSATRAQVAAMLHRYAERVQ